MSIAQLFTQTVSVETLTAGDANGHRYAAPVTVACYIEDSSKDVRNSDGEQVVSSARLFAALSTAPSAPATAGQFAPGSRVTVNGRKSLVITIARRDGLGPASAHHLQVSLT